MKKTILLIAILSLIFHFAYAQEDEEWKTEIFTTGYFALNGEYINNLPVFEEIKGRNYGLNIGEASILTSLRPLEKLKINSVITYKPKLNWDQMIAEMSAEWTFSEAFKIKTGRFLLPLHPPHSQYYAPMNIGIALPVFVTNHVAFPLNINGINLSGRAPLNSTLSVCYQLVGGQYTKMTRTETGILGFFGRDGVYMSEDSKQVSAMITKFENEDTGEYPQFFGTGGKLCLEVGNVAKIGVASFYSTETLNAQIDPTTVIQTDVELVHYGVNFMLDYNNLIMKLSAWGGTETPNDTQNFDTYKVELYYSEISYTINKLTPYVKVEVINGRVKKWTRTSFGLNYRPFFETTFKLEYHRYLQEYVDDFDIFQLSAVYSF